MSAAAAAIERLRDRLIDCPADDLLLNFRQDGDAVVLRLVGEPPNRLFARAQEQRPLTFEPVPAPSEREIRAFFRDNAAPSQEPVGDARPDAARWARQQGWNVSYELPIENAASQGPDQALRVLLYPDQLDARLRRLRSDARLAIEESGSNLLYLAFGFLEWRERPTPDATEVPPAFLAPLVLLPARIDSQTSRRGVRGFALTGSGEDLQPNLALRRKLAADFAVELPEFADDDTPEAYFQRVRQVIGGEASWRIRRFVTLGLIPDVGKALLYRDLDPIHWPDGAAPADHTVVRRLVVGELPADPPPTELDAAADVRAGDLDLCLVDRADATQVSAMLQALAGDSLVIQGPPGTGKSQTITNLIAAALDRGETVLFVAQKLAALEVVKRRLREARLGAFCLELYGRRAGKRTFYADLRERLAKRAEESPGAIDDAVAALAALRDDLDSYRAVLAEPAGRTGMAIADLLFEAGRVRAEDEDLTRSLDIAGVPERVGEAVDPLAIDAYSDAETTRAFAGVAQAQAALDAIGGPRLCPWRGVENPLLALAAQPPMQAVATWHDKAAAAAAAIADLNRETGLALAADNATFAELQGLADGRVDLPGLAVVAAELQHELTALSADFDLPLAAGFAGLRDALRVLKLVAAAPDRQLGFAHAGLDSPYAAAALARLVDTQQRRGEILAALQGRIDRPDAAGLDEAALRAAGRRLVEAGAFAWFDRELSEARRLARSLAPPGIWATSKTQGEALLLLAERVALDAQIAGDPEIREASGEHFRGAETDAEGLRRAWEWRRAVHAEFRAGRDRRFRETLAAAGSDEIIEIRERTAGPIARLGAVVRDIVGGDAPPALNDFWPAIAREIAPGRLADNLEQRDGEASVAAFMRCVVAAAVAGRELGEAQDRALAALQFDAAKWFGSSADIPAEAIAERAAAAVRHPDGLALWLAYATARGEADRPGAGPLIDAMAEGTVALDRIAQAWRIAWLTEAARRLHASNPVLLRFDGPRLDGLRREYARLDAAVMELRQRAVAARLMRRPAPEGIRGTRTRDMTERALLAHCAAMERRQPAIRDVIARAGGALRALKPCFMMGPLAVARYLPPGAVGFDLVIVDEASQLRPEVVLGAVARGGRLVVVGDDRQLPPTSLFDRVAAADAGSEQQAAADDDSLLTLANARLPVVQGRLRRHYRAQRPELIAFSNCHFYNNEMIFLPAPDEGNRATVLTHIVVRQGSAVDGVNDAEARRVAQAAVDQLRTRPDQSLMVVAMNPRQQQLIESHIARLEVTNRGLPELLDAAESDARIEPFVVKDLENIQGDQRDVVMISMTYGPPAAGGGVPQVFGAIDREHGDRRLNVLMTRAREQLVVFASLHAGDIEVGPDGLPGPCMLQRLLQFVETRELPGAPRLSGKLPESPFETMLLRQLEGAGYQAEPQFGSGPDRIDIAVRNPDVPEQYLLAIEGDGPMYHRTLSARERDRLRPQALQNLGWELARVWSVDWFRQPQAAVQRILERLAALRRQRQVEGPVRETLTRFLPEPAPAQPGQVGPRLRRALTRDETRLALIGLRERIERELPDADPARGLLRQTMLEELLRRRPADAGEWTAKIPDELREATDGAQLSRYGRELFRILAGTAPLAAP
jgi:hypothetical protein